MLKGFLFKPKLSIHLCFCIELVMWICLNLGLKGIVVEDGFVSRSWF